LINNSFKNKSNNQFKYVTWFSNFKNQITTYETIGSLLVLALQPPVLSGFQSNPKQ
jgi:hypothetical protein